MNYFEKVRVLDGGFGTELVKRNAPMGSIPEELNITHPEIVKEVHRAYVEAGADIIYANTFGANHYKCKRSKYSVTELVTAAIKNAKEAAGGTDTLVAVDMGTIGDILEPFGNLKFTEAYDYYKEMIVAGEKAGADLLVFETQTDLQEVKAGVLAAKENSKLPIFVTMTFESNGRTFTGTDARCFAITMEALGVQAIGVNCSLGPRELVPIVKNIAEYTNLPIIVKPNAGLPDPMTGKYDMNESDFREEIKAFLEMGVSFIGGCCGTSPEFISELKSIASLYTPKEREKLNKSFLCSQRAVVDVENVHVVGERINPTGKKLFKEALLNHDIDYIKARAIEQTEAGAEILDVNVGLPKIDEVSLMEEVVKELLAIVETPLQIDSSDARAIEAALRIYPGKALVNSVNGEDAVLDKILPIAKKYGAAIIGLTMDERGIPKTVSERVSIAEHIVKRASEYGIEPKDIYIDCLTLTASVEQSQVKNTLEAIREVKEKFHVNTVLGVSNISFGLPKREFINTTFLTLAMEAGLNLPIINPNNQAMMGAVDAYKVLMGIDERSENYVSKYADIEAKEKEANKVPKADGKESIKELVRKGLKDQVKNLIAEMIKTKDPLDIVNNELIPALDAVGASFEKGVIFLPQLLSAAEASEAGFSVIKEELSKKNAGSISKGKVVLATVKGDVHDIGKNIVKTILENYGFTVIDLGKDVPPEKVVDAAREHEVKLVGLSALMTTTVVAMEETIKQIKNAKLPCKVVVGGAVLTPDFAMQIGADYYSKDAKQTADIANEVYGIK